MAPSVTLVVNGGQITFDDATAIASSELTSVVAVDDAKGIGNALEGALARP